MVVGRITSRIARTVVSRYQSALVRQPRSLSIIGRRAFHGSPNKVIPPQISFLHSSALTSSPFQRFGFSSSASSEVNEKRTSDSDAKENASSDDKGLAHRWFTKKDQKVLAGWPDLFPSIGRLTRKISFRGEEDLTMDDLVKIVTEKEELLKAKQEEIADMKDKVLRTYAETENIMARTKREAENSKKFAIQGFAKGLLDVADNLDRASSVVKESFAKLDTSSDSSGAVPLLKTLLEGVEMTEKQLAEVFKKFGVEKYDPTNEEFDPNRHNAVFQVPDPTKDPDTVAVVLKAGYTLHDRIIRPAEVGVTIKVD